MKVIIRQSEETDLMKILQIHRAAFGRDAESDLVKGLLSSSNKIDELSLLACREGEPEKPVGHILLSIVRLTDSKSKKVLALAPLAVLPVVQRTGIGSALVEASSDRANALGYSAIVVLGDGNFYGRFGFEVSRDFGVFPPFEVESANFRLKTLASFDKTLKGTVIYPDIFNSV